MTVAKSPHAFKNVVLAACHSILAAARDEILAGGFQYLDGFTFVSLV